MLSNSAEPIIWKSGDPSCICKLFSRVWGAIKSIAPTLTKPLKDHIVFYSLEGKYKEQCAEDLNPCKTDLKWRYLRPDYLTSRSLNLWIVLLTRQKEMLSQFSKKILHISQWNRWKCNKIDVSFCLNKDTFSKKKKIWLTHPSIKRFWQNKSRQSRSALLNKSDSPPIYLHLIFDIV